jgi:hypothetical protein
MSAMILNLVDLSHKTPERDRTTSDSRRSRVPRGFSITCKSIELGEHQQLRYVKGDRDLSPESKGIMYDNEVGVVPM